MRRQGPILIAAAMVAMTACGADAQESAMAQLKNAAGETVGTVTLTQAAAGGVHLDIDVSGLEPGVHAIHIHETGRCEPDFGAAGGHFAPHGNAHGWKHENGAHAGDMLNLHVPSSGSIRAERLAPLASLRDGDPGFLFDVDGSAIIIHAGADDYISQPSGDAGDRAACGVVQR